MPLLPVRSVPHGRQVAAAELIHDATQSVGVRLYLVAQPLGPALCRRNDALDRRERESMAIWSVVDHGVDFGVVEEGCALTTAALGDLPREERCPHAELLEPARHLSH